MFKILLILFLFIFLFFPYLFAEELKVVLDRDYPPFTYIDEKGNLVGISVEFWKLWEERTGIKVKLIPVEWTKAHEMMKNKEADVIDTIFKTEERKEYLDFTKPLFKMTSSIYHNSKLHKIFSLDDITPYLVGVKEKDALIDISLSKNPNLTFRFYKNYSDIVKGAEMGEINVFIMDDIPANFYLIKYDLLYKFSKTEPFTFNYLYLATQKGNTSILNILNNGLSKIKAEELESLVKKYTVVEEYHPKWLGRAILYTLLAVFLIIFFLSLFNRTLKRQVSIATTKLKESQEELERAVGRIWKIFALISDLTNIKLREKLFLRRVLDFVMETFPKINSAILFILKGDELKPLEVYGFNEGWEEKVLKVKDPSILEKINLINKRDFPSFFQNLEDSFENIEELIILPIKEKEYVIFLNIHKGNKENFTEIDLNLAEWFENINSRFYEFRNFVKKEETFLNRIILTLLRALEYYDKYTEGHSARVAKYAIEIAEKLNLPGETIRKLYWSALVHDIGKIYVSQRILNKPERLTKEEYEFVKIHPVKSEELLKDIEELREIAHIVRYHHERWDGKGYPDGLSKEEIPLESRILAIADAFDAMTSERPYKRALTLKEAIKEIERCSGSQLDPKLSEIMIGIIKEEIFEKTPS